jgi:hypothetical protein
VSSLEGRKEDFPFNGEPQHLQASPTSPSALDHCELRDQKRQGWKTEIKPSSNPEKRGRGTARHILSPAWPCSHLTPQS